jgi:hypothetical protein
LDLEAFGDEIPDRLVEFLERLAALENFPLFLDVAQ